MNHLKYYLTLIIAFTLLTIGNFLNAEDINLSDENVVFSLLQGKSFHCLMKETNYNGPVIIEIKSLTKNKFKGVSNEFCFQEIDWSGKFKKNKMKIVQHGASAQTCYCRSGLLVFTKNSEGRLFAKGHYGVSCGATPFRGELECEIK